MVSDLNNGNYLDAGFATADTALAYALAAAGPEGIALDVLLNYYGGTKAAAQAAAQAGCLLGGGS